MDRKNKVWRIVLVALLLLAIIALLFFNSKLNASREALSTATAQLAAEQESSAGELRNMGVKRLNLFEYVIRS